VLNAGQDYKLLISLAASTVSVMVDDRAVVGHAFNAVVVDGAFGAMARGGGASFNDFTLKTSDSRFREPAPEMLVAATAATTTAPADANVTQAQLDPIVAAAVERWSQALGGADIGAALGGVVFVVGDLKGQALAQTVGNVVVIDINAAGHGWFIDPTPDDDAEFTGQSASGALKAPASSPAYGRMDLLSVVMHEIGHLLGFGHDATALGSVTAGSLETGTRLTIDGAGATQGSPPPAVDPGPAPLPAPPPPTEEPEPAPSPGPGKGRKG
jgi:hypothetical protein